MSRLPRPSRLDPDADPIVAAGTRGDGYRLEFELRGPPGGVALQRVDTEIRYLSGEQVVLRYQGHYYEFFRFASDGSLGRPDGSPQLDVHAFGLREDGWTPGDLRRLTRELGLRLPLWLPGPTRITCEKRFLLGLAKVEGEQAAVTCGDGGAFGYLAAGPGEPPTASIELDTAGERTPLVPSSALPSDHEPAGEGRFLEPRGWAARERFEYLLAASRTSFDPGGGYRASPLPG